MSTGAGGSDAPWGIGSPSAPTGRMVMYRLARARLIRSSISDPER